MLFCQLRLVFIPDTECISCKQFFCSSSLLPRMHFWLGLCNKGHCARVHKRVSGVHFKDLAIMRPSLAYMRTTDLLINPLSHWLRFFDRFSMTYNFFSSLWNSYNIRMPILFSFDLSLAFYFALKPCA